MGFVGPPLACSKPASMVPFALLIRNNFASIDSALAWPGAARLSPIGPTVESLSAMLLSNAPLVRPTASRLAARFADEGRNVAAGGSFPFSTPLLWISAIFATRSSTKPANFSHIFSQCRNCFALSSNLPSKSPHCSCVLSTSSLMRLPMSVSRSWRRREDNLSLLPDSTAKASRSFLSAFAASSCLIEFQIKSVSRIIVWTSVDLATCVISSLNSATRSSCSPSFWARLSTSSRACCPNARTCAMESSMRSPMDFTCCPWLALKRSSSDWVSSISRASMRSLEHFSCRRPCTESWSCSHCLAMPVASKACAKSGICVAYSTRRLSAKCSSEVWRCHLPKAARCLRCTRLCILHKPMRRRELIQVCSRHAATMSLPKASWRRSAWAELKQFKA
mmetsp:Transcript_65589/g.182370  ORF Transcript_65589/g.182370 Transcript_65589/m.182370 type:complete len:393 (+) Transcript_65589:258-1436(+)